MRLGQYLLSAQEDQERVRLLDLNLHLVQRDFPTPARLELLLWLQLGDYTCYMSSMESVPQEQNSELSRKRESCALQRWMDGRPVPQRPELSFTSFSRARA